MSTMIGFDAFWEQYPRKVGKLGARKAWARLNPDEAQVAEILEAVEAQAASTWTDPQYIPHPTTWLNGRRWEDVVIQPSSRRVHSELRNRKMVDEWARYYPRRGDA